MNFDIAVCPNILGCVKSLKLYKTSATHPKYWGTSKNCASHKHIAFFENTWRRVFTDNVM